MQKRRNEITKTIKHRLSQACLGGFAGIAFLITVLVISLALSIVAPQAAFASYSNPSIASVAQVRTDGSLHVAERRSFDLDTQYSILTWEITGLPSEATVSIESLRLSCMDAEGNVTMDWMSLSKANFDPDWRELISQTDGKTAAIEAFDSSLQARDANAYIAKLPAAGHFAFDSRNNCVYLFVDPTSDLIVVECDYLADEAVLAFDDVAELYWDYVEAKSDVETGSVRTQIQLPVPEGATVVPGDNVMAWGHGPAGTLSINNDGTIDFAVNDVREGQYAQAHIIFPVKWLSNITLQQRFANSGLRADAARTEEAVWIDSYSAGMINSYVVAIIYCVICLLLIIVSVFLYMFWGRPHEVDAISRFAAADLINKYGLAIAGRCARWNYWSPDDFALALKTLVKKGAIKVREAAVKTKSDDDQSCTTVRLQLTHNVKDVSLTKIEQEALRFIFGDIGMDYQSVSVNDILQWCRNHQDKTKETMYSWQKLLDSDVAKADIFDKKSFAAAKYMWIACALLLIWGVWTLISSGISWQIGLFLITGALIGLIAYNTPRRTQTGVDLELAVQMDDGDLQLDCWQQEIVSVLV